MGWQSAALMGGRIARAGALVLGSLVLAHCSAGNKDSRYSAKVVEDGEPVPKGGGNYQGRQALHHQRPHLFSIREHVAIAPKASPPGTALISTAG